MSQPLQKMTKEDLTRNIRVDLANLDREIASDERALEFKKGRRRGIAETLERIEDNL